MNPYVCCGSRLLCMKILRVRLHQASESMLRQVCHEAVRMLTILFSLKAMESLQNDLQPIFKGLHCFQWVSLASSQSCGSVDSDNWCKRGPNRAYHDAELYQADNVSESEKKDDEKDVCGLPYIQITELISSALSFVLVNWFHVVLAQWLWRLFLLHPHTHILAIHWLHWIHWTNILLRFVYT